MTTVKRLLVGAIAVLATTTIIPTVGASASTLDGGKGYSISQNFEAKDVLGVSQATGWVSSNYDKYKDTSTEEETIIPGVRTFSKDGTWKVLLGNGMQEGWSAGIAGRSPIPIKHAQGWVKEADGFWRYGNADGTAKTGWFQDKGTWYYSYASLDGGMAINTYVGSYKVDSSGALIQNAVVPNTRQGHFGTEYLGETSGSVFFDSTFQNAYTVPLRTIDDLLTQGKLIRGNFNDSNAGDISGWYLKQ